MSKALNERGTVTLRVISPCEHGKSHPILELQEGSAFSVDECRDSKGVPKSHLVTPEKYPQTVKRR